MSTEYVELGQNCSAQAVAESERPESRLDKDAEERAYRTSLDRADGVCQWADQGSGVFRATTKTVKQLPPGVYSAELDHQNNMLMVKRTIITDDLIELPDTGGDEILAGIRKFWTRKAAFASKKQIFKRGVLLWGPPGGGKTSVIMQLTNDLVKNGGIVLYVTLPNMATEALRQIRDIEPDRPLICVLEDIDEITRRYGEHELLGLLDGETQIANIVFLATTNYPENLAKRIINRPSRFDIVKKIGVPTASARRIYFEVRLPELQGADLDKWVNDTDGLSIAHLRELMVSVYCLDNDYQETIDRLKSMNKTLNSDDGKVMGF